MPCSSHIHIKASLSRCFNWQSCSISKVSTSRLSTLNSIGNGFSSQGVQIPSTALPISALRPFPMASLLQILMLHKIPLPFVNQLQRILMLHFVNFLPDSMILHPPMSLR
uniref:Uncharacterized protein n=1 Tax=Rhizophora mucronata TaxID=61149 RepID=A0A2P2IJY5_RHIMU